MRGLPGIFAECGVVPCIVVKFDTDLDIREKEIASFGIEKNSFLLGILKYYPKMEISPHQKVFNKTKSPRKFLFLLLSVESGDDGI